MLSPFITHEQWMKLTNEQRKEIVQRSYEAQGNIVRLHLHMALVGAVGMIGTAIFLIWMVIKGA